MRQAITAFLLVTTLILISENSLAQSSGEITGTITDSSGAVVAQAELQLINQATNVTLTGTSNEEGGYRFGGLQPGTYTLAVRRTGFAETRIAGVVVEVNRISRTDVVLQVSATEATVNIQAGAQLLDTETGTKGTTIPIKQMRDLPLASRNPLSLMLLAPGSVATAAPGGGIATGNRQGSDGTGATAGYTINGGLRRGGGGYQEYVVDGISITSQRDGVITALPAADALQEFRVQSGGMSAEFGRTVGGVVSYVTDTGTNQFHGNLFESVRNTALNARRAIPAIGNKPVTQYNQFGGTIGGPIWLPEKVFGPAAYDGRNRSFFFFGYDGSRFVRNNPTTATVPTLKMRGATSLKSARSFTIRRATPPPPIARRLRTTSFPPRGSTRLAARSSTASRCPICRAWRTITRASSAPRRRWTITRCGWIKRSPNGIASSSA